MVPAHKISSIDISTIQSIVPVTGYYVRVASLGSSDGEVLGPFFYVNFKTAYCSKDGTLYYFENDAKDFKILAGDAKWP